jgi:protein SCO1/2
MNETFPYLRLLLLTLLLSLGVAGCSKAAEEPPLKGSTIGGAFTLTDQNGRSVSDRNFAGRYRVVYFGYTHCPDVCPTDLLTISQALAAFEKSDPSRAAKVQPIFISVDPERDTPPMLKQYLASFHPRLIGLTGTPGQIDAVAKRFVVFHQKGEVQPGGGYAVDHSRMVLLMGPKGEPLALLPDDKGPAAMAAELDKWVA